MRRRKHALGTHILCMPNRAEVSGIVHFLGCTLTLMLE